MKTEDLTKEVQNILKQRKGEAPREISQPMLEGDTYTFAIPEGKTAKDVLVYHPARPNNNGTDTISEYFAVVSADGREVSQRNLVGRKGNGFNVPGDTPDERLTNFMAMLADGKKVGAKIVKLRILPSTRKGWDDQRIPTWEMA